jgi:hypothetical protein
MKFSATFAAISIVLYSKVVLGITPVTVKGNGEFG